MHLEQVELLRCPSPHASGVLVAASDVTSARYIMQGVLGCPGCGAEFQIRNGISIFDTDAGDAEFSADEDATDTAGEQALRVAAQLSMTEGRSVYALVNSSARIVMALRELVPARLMLVNPADILSLHDPSVALAIAPAGIVRTHDMRPLAHAKFDGVAFAREPWPDALDQAVKLLKPGGRLVAPAGCELPGGVTELVRDEREWVAVRDSVASQPVGITRR
ncbi:MAG: hypothetical protein H7Z40_18460 [Phycisphaerae bacterium]|nr:hypothetical protein [Gemmatimonadaceae bacterium]